MIVVCRCGFGYEQDDWWACPECDAPSPDLLRDRHRADRPKPSPLGPRSLRALLRMERLTQDDEGR